MSPRISVIMPSRDAGAYIDAALRSVRLQSVAVHEVILVDNESTDDTLRIAEAHVASGLPLRILQGPCRGPGPARNLGVAAAEGDLIAFLDADDLWPEGKLARQGARLAADPRVEMVSGYTCYFETADDEGLRPAAGSRTERIFHVHVGSCLYRRDVFDRIGGAFDEDFLYSEDVDLLLRLRESDLPFSILHSVELYYRKHSASMMARADPRRDADFRLAAHKSLRRRRATGQLKVPLRDFSDYLEPQA